MKPPELNQVYRLSFLKDAFGGWGFEELGDLTVGNHYIDICSPITIQNIFLWVIKSARAVLKQTAHEPFLIA